MKPYLERLTPEPASSLSLLNRKLDEAIPFQWHHHPEYELTLTLNSRGQRFIGDHIGDYADGDLVLIGPHLPHSWASRDKIDHKQPHRALVIWFTPEQVQRLSRGFVEFQPIEHMLIQAAHGLQFSAASASAVRPAIETLFILPPAARLLSLFNIFATLAEDTAAQKLSSHPIQPHAQPESRDRIDRVLSYIHQHYMEKLALNNLAAIAALSVSGLHRLFSKQTGTTISAYIIRLRIGDASAKLASTQQPVAHIAMSTGYESLANFNRQFKKAKGVTPRAYRTLFQPQTSNAASPAEPTIRRHQANTAKP